LDTDDYAAAAARLPGVLAELRGARNASEAGSLGAALEIEADRKDPTLKATTRTYYKERSKALLKVAEELPVNPMNISIARVTLADLRTLMDEYAGKSSATSYNGALALLRRTFCRALEAGHCGTNPALSLKRLKPRKMKHDLPTIEVFSLILEDIRAQRKAFSKATAFSIEFLAFTGLRISESQSVYWRDIKSDHLIVRTVKGDDIRQVPLIPACKALLGRMKAAEIPTGDNDPVMLVKSPREALKGACERLKIDHMRVHDLRHIFATRCIESGVDIPTLADWLGHKDGGVLALQIYGHLCKKHSTAMAGRVKA